MLINKFYINWSPISISLYQLITIYIQFMQSLMGNQSAYYGMNSLKLFNNFKFI